MEERFLYHIWDEGHLQYDLACCSGQPVKIIYQGQYNTGRGPDFKNAIIAIGEKELRGDVEIHLKSSDWRAHKHHEDARYNSVILHVVLQHNLSSPFTIKEDGEVCEILNLKDHLSEDIQKLLREHDDSKEPAVYCDLLSAIDSDRLLGILHTAGLRRFEGKRKRFNAALSLSSFDQILYEGIFEALGYSKNKLNTLQLAQSLPISLIRKFKAEGMNKEQLLSIYLCSSGLLKKSSKLLDGERVAKIWRDYEIQAFFAKKLVIDWQLFRIRPQNHPIKRIIYISDFIWETADSGLIAAFNRTTETEDDLYKAFQSVWIPHQVLPDGKSLKLGSSVQKNIFLNIYLPVMTIWREKMSLDTEPFLKAYRDFPPLQENFITRFMERYINPSQLKLAKSKAIYQQGLLDIYHRFCNWHSCTQCMERHKSGQ